MTLRSRYVLAAVVALRMAHPAEAQEVTRLSGAPLPAALAAVPNSNQQVANTIAEQLRQSPMLRGQRIDVVFRDGLAELHGTLADPMQNEEAVRITREVPGVQRVRNNLQVGAALMQTQAVAPMPRPLPPPPNGNGAPAEPLPIFQAGYPGGDLPPPQMPPYAWPTYAPYNNYSRVGYPLAYPYNAWPFIGPCYPFPKIPLGWRSVKLEWEDGHWWFSKVACKHDWWRLRYW